MEQERTNVIKYSQSKSVKHHVKGRKLMNDVY